MISKIITKIKGEKWEFDNQISTLYLSKIIIKRIIMYCRGVFLFLRFKPIILVGKKNTILNKKKIQINGNLIIDKYCHIDPTSINGIIIGNNVSIGKYTTIECSGSLKKLGKGLIIGNNVGLGTHGFFGCAGGITIGDDCIFGNFVSMHSENHNFAALGIPIRLQGINRRGIEIGNDCWIGAKATILDDVQLGNGCIVAAGATVKKGRYPDYSIIGGVPAKIISYRKIIK